MWTTYADFPQRAIPAVLRKTEALDLTTTLPENQPLHIDPVLPTFIYTFYNLDPEWARERKANRILLIDHRSPS